MPDGLSRGVSRSARRTLVADTDIATGRLLSRDLLSEGFEVEVAMTAAAVLSRVTETLPDTIVLGSDLPDMGALDLIKTLQVRSGPPLLMLLTDPAEASVVAALDTGAQDCMTKPFLVPELGARLRKLVRRRLISQGCPTAIRSGPLDLDVVRWHAMMNGVEVYLSSREQAVLRILVEDSGNVVSHREMLAQIWGISALGSRSRIRHVVRNLRRKLGLTLDGAVQLLAEPQIGYRLVVAGSATFPRPGTAG